MRPSKLLPTRKQNQSASGFRRHQAPCDEHSKWERQGAAAVGRTGTPQVGRGGREALQAEASREKSPDTY